jgi:glycerol kinase
MTANNWLLQFLADMLNVEVQRPACIETSALGVAYLAGLQIGLYQSLEEIAQLWKVSSRFVPGMGGSEREGLYEGWKQAVRRVVM